MSDNARLGLVVAASILLGLAGCQGRPAGKVPEPEPEGAKIIPLKSIYSTNGQEGLKMVRGGDTEGYHHHLNLLRRECRSGASNVFLVRGDDFATAVKSTWQVFRCGCSADVPKGPSDDQGQRSLWLVAFLGIDGSSPPAWLLKGAVQKGNVIRLSVAQPERLAVSADLYHYFVWVPLGKLEASTYTLELFNAEQGEVTLVRRVRWVQGQ